MGSLCRENSILFGSFPGSRAGSCAVGKCALPHDGLFSNMSRTNSPNRPGSTAKCTSIVGELELLCGK